MIGFSAILILSMFIIIPGAMFLVALKQRNCLFAFFAGGFLLLTSGMVFVKAADMWNLYTLDPEDVASVQLDGTEVVQRDKIESIVEALNSPSWFMVNHGGWEVDVPLVVTLKSGESTELFVSPYLREEGGAVIHARREAFSYTLPKAIEAVDLYIPDGKSWEEIPDTEGVMLDPKSIHETDQGTQAWIKLPVSNSYKRAFRIVVTDERKFALLSGDSDGFMGDFSVYSGPPQKAEEEDKLFPKIVDHINEAKPDLE